MLHSIFNPLAGFKYLSIFSISLIFPVLFVRTAKSTSSEVLFFFLLMNTKSGFLVGIKGIRFYLKISEFYVSRFL